MEAMIPAFCAVLKSAIWERFDLGTNRWRIISSKNKARQLYIRSIRSNWRVLQTVIAGRARIY
jgi:hypothetical protein